MSRKRKRPQRLTRQGRGSELATARAGNLRQLLLKASRIINEDVTAALRSAGFRDLKNSHVFCLAHIDLDGTSIVELAERSHISKQAASKLVGELVAFEILSTSPSPLDGRAVRVRFTPHGRRLMDQSFQLFTEIENEYCRRLGARTYATLKRALRMLGERPPSE